MRYTTRFYNFSAQKIEHTKSGTQIANLSLFFSAWVRQKRTRKHYKRYTGCAKSAPGSVTF